MRGKDFSVTFPRCEVERAVFDAAFISQHGPFAEYVSARELHSDGGHHLHLFLRYKSRKDLRSARALDVAIDGRTFHPNIQKCRCRDDWLMYLSKESDHGDWLPSSLSRESFDPLSAELGRRKSMFTDHQWSEQFRVVQSLHEPDYPIRLSCSGITYEMARPDPKLKRRSWWIVAAPNAGKTRWLNFTFAGCRVFSPRVGPYPFEDYLDQDIIVYDDREGVKFEEFAAVLNTWLIVQPIAGQIRYVTKYWKVGHTRSVIVLSNKTIESSVPPEDVDRMRKRFIQIVDPVLIPPEDRSVSPPLSPLPSGAPAANQSFAGSSSLSAQLFSDFLG